MSALVQWLFGSLHRQLLIGISLLVSLLMAVGIYSMTMVQESISLERNKQQTISLALNASVTASVWLATHDYAALQETVVSFSHFPDVDYVMVLDMRNQVMAHTASEKRGQYVTGLPHDERLHILQQNRDRIDILYPIVLVDHQIGWLLMGSTRAQLQQEVHQMQRQGVVVALIGLLLSVLFAMVVSRYFVRRIHRIQVVADGVQAGDSSLRVQLSGHDEAARLAQQMNQMLDALVDRESAIYRLNETLEARVQEEVQKSRQKDLILIQQSRLASMGEMIHNIAHQWRQPLNSLAMLIANIQDDYNYNELTRERLTSAVAKSQTILNQMSNTIDDFKDFFKPDKEAKAFDLAKVIDDSLVIIEASLFNNQIALIKQYVHPLPCYGYHSQLSQALLNLLTNAKDAIKERHIVSGEVRITAYIQDGAVYIEVADNAGGIDEQVIDKVFDPYFTTKDSGSGIGLYMARMIVERGHNGTINVVNEAGGAKFTIRIPQQATQQTNKDSLHDQL